MPSSVFNRRTFLRATAASAAALALPLDASAAPPRAAVTLEFWNPATDKLGHKIIGDIVDQFNRSVGKAQGITVQSRTVPDTNDAVKYTTAMSSPSGSPDVVMTYSYSHVATWGANGFIQPLDAFASTVGLKQSEYFPIAWDLLHVNSHVWGLLQEFDMDQLYWNKAIHKGASPRTIAELDALAARYTKFDKKGNLVQVGIVPWSTSASGNTAVSSYADWGALWGASFYDHARGKWTINTPQNRKFLDWMLKYVHMLGGRAKAEALVSSTQAGFSGDVFMAGKAAFWLEGEWMPPVFKATAPKLQYGIARMPVAPGVPYGTGVTGGGNMFLLPTRSPHPREAALLIKYLGAASAVNVWNTEEGGVPPIKATAYSEKFKTDVPYMASYLDTLEANHMVRAIPSPVFPVFDSEMSNAVDAVTYQKKTPAQALAYVDQKVSSAAQQFKSFHPNWPSE